MPLGTLGECDAKWQNPELDSSWSGIASGTLTAFRQTGSVLGVALFGSLLAGLGATAGLRTASAIATGLVLAVAALNFTTR